MGENFLVLIIRRGDWERGRRGDFGISVLRRILLQSYLIQIPDQLKHRYGSIILLNADI